MLTPPRSHIILAAALVLMLSSVTGSALADTIGSGSISAQFLNPDPPCPPVTCTGVGTNSIFWGMPEPGQPPNNLSFTGRGFGAQLGEPFVLGLLQFQNGSTPDVIETVDFRLQSTSFNNDPTFIQTAQLNVTIVSTPNLGIDPAADADYLYFTEFPQFGSFRVHEGQVSTVEILGAFNSLDVLGFGQRFELGFSGFGDVGNPAIAFTNPSITPSLLGALDAEIPEPSTWLLMLGGLWVLWLRRRAAAPSIALHPSATDR